MHRADERIANNWDVAVTIKMAWEWRPKREMKEEVSTLQEGRVLETLKNVIFEQFA